MRLDTRLISLLIQLVMLSFVSWPSCCLPCSECGNSPDLMQAVDNFTLRRFLRARDLDIDKASAMLLKYLKWRREIMPNGFISEEEVKNELAQKKFFAQGFDKKGRPLGVLLGAKHYSSKRNLEEFKRMYALLVV